MDAVANCSNKNEDKLFSMVHNLLWLHDNEYNRNNYMYGYSNNT